MKRLAVILSLLAMTALRCPAGQTVTTPTTYGSGSSLTIQSGVHATFSAGSVVDFTGATVNGLSAGLPSQTSNNHKFLTTNGSVASWTHDLFGPTVINNSTGSVKMISIGSGAFGGDDSHVVFFPDDGGASIDANGAFYGSNIVVGEVDSDYIKQGGSLRVDLDTGQLVSSDGSATLNWITNGNGLSFPTDVYDQAGTPSLSTESRTLFTGNEDANEALKWSINGITVPNSDRTFLIGASSIPNLSATLGAGGGQLLISNPAGNTTRYPFGIVGNYRNGVSGERYFSGFAPDGHFTTSQYAYFSGNGSGGGTESGGYMLGISMDVPTGLSISAGDQSSASTGRLISAFGTPTSQATWGRVFEVNVRGGTKLSNPYGQTGSVQYNQPQLVFADVGANSASPAWTYGSIHQTIGHLKIGTYDGSSTEGGEIDISSGAVTLGNNVGITFAGTGAATTRTNLQISDAGNVKVYRAVVFQSSTSAPTATVKENTLGGTVVWTRTAPGIYTGTLSGAFGASATDVWLSAAGGDASAGGQQAVLLVWNSANSVILNTNADLSGTWTASDGVLAGRPACVEIRVYP